MIKQEAPWLNLVHCFNHRVKLAIKDPFPNSSFKSVNELMMELHYLFEKSPLKTLAEAVNKNVPKSSCTPGKKWMNHKYQAMKNILEKCGEHDQHKSLTQTDFQAKRRSFLCKSFYVGGNKQNM